MPVVRDSSKFSSRKFFAFIITSVLIIVAGAVGGWLPVMAAQLAVIVGGLISAFAIYAGGNVARHWVASKASLKEEAAEEPEAPADPPAPEKPVEEKDGNAPA